MSAPDRKRKIVAALASGKRARKEARLPTFAECRRLFLSSSDMWQLSLYDDALIGCFTLLKHRNGEGCATTSLVEIAGVVSDHFRPYTTSIDDLSREDSTRRRVESTLGFKLIMPDGELRICSLVNIRQRAPRQAEYNKWAATAHKVSVYPMRGQVIENRADMTETLVARVRTGYTMKV